MLATANPPATASIAPIRDESSFLDLLRTIWGRRSLIMLMAVRTLQTRYAGTLVGLCWSIIHPLALVLVYWIVFSLGFRVKPVGNAPFIAVFLCGFIPWTLLSETLTANANAITGNPHLVKKTVFP